LLPPSEDEDPLAGFLETIEDEAEKPAKRSYEPDTTLR
jgi:hypothetical protein